MCYSPPHNFVDLGVTVVSKITTTECHNVLETFEGDGIPREVVSFSFNDTNWCDVDVF